MHRTHMGGGGGQFEKLTMTMPGFQSGLYIDNELRENGNYGGLNNYRPVTDPSSEDSEPQAVVLHRFTGESLSVVVVVMLAIMLVT